MRSAIAIAILCCGCSPPSQSLGSGDGGGDGSGSAGTVSPGDGSALAECPLGSGVAFDFSVTAPPSDQGTGGSAENPTQDRQAECVVDDVVQTGWVYRFLMTCDELDGEPDGQWELMLQMPENTTPPLSKGMAISIQYQWYSWFEVGRGRRLQVDAASEPVLLAYDERAEAIGSSASCDPDGLGFDEDAREFFAPLGMNLVAGTCDPTDTLRLDVSAGAEVVSLYPGDQKPIADTGWTAAVTVATCDESGYAEGGAWNDGLWTLDVVAWRD